MPDASPDDQANGLIDGVLVDELATTFGPDIPRFSASDEGLAAGFLATVHDYVRSWLEENGSTEVPPCAFVQSRMIEIQAADLGAPLKPYFCSMPDGEIGGRLFIANDDLSQVHELDLGCSTVEQLGRALADRGLEMQTHAIFRPDRGELIVCEMGWSGATRREKVRLSHTRLTTRQLELTIWQFHREFTQTPSGLLHCWRGKAAHRVTAEKLERSISAMLWRELAMMVGRDSVVMEPEGPHGRADVFVNCHGMANSVGACILELKVLRSRRYSSRAKAGWVPFNDADMIEHASDGIMQARNYLDDQRARRAYLLCFDARLADVDQPEVLALARRLKVKVRRYFMYASPKAERDAARAALQAGAKLSGEP